MKSSFNKYSTVKKTKLLQLKWQEKNIEDGSHVLKLITQILYNKEIYILTHTVS